MLIKLYDEYLLERIDKKQVFNQRNLREFSKVSLLLTEFCQAVEETYNDICTEIDARRNALNIEKCIRMVLFSGITAKY